MTKEETKMITGREDAVFKLALKLEEVIKEVDKVVGDLKYIEVEMAFAVVNVRVIEQILEKCKTNDETEKDS